MTDRAPKLVTSGRLDDASILAAHICSMSEEVTDHISLPGAVAQHIISLDVRSGAELVLPVASLVKRTASTNTMGGLPYNSTLADLRQALIESTDARNRASTALALGDKGAMGACGYDWDKLRSVMGQEEAYRYCTHMALLGYGTALDVTRALKNAPVAKSIPQHIEVLIERFADVVLILRRLVGFDVERVLG